MATAGSEARTVLLVEDNPCDARLVERALAVTSQARYRVEHVTLLSAAVERLRRGDIDVALVDLSLPDSSGLETVRALLAAAPAVPMVVVTGLDDEQVAIDLLQHGAQDYLLKQDIEPKLLARTIRYAIERSRATALESLNRQLEEAKASLTKAVAELQQTNEDLAQFTYFASHDLQEPVRKISYFAGQLREDIGDGLSEDARIDFHYLSDAAYRMQALIRSLLVLCKAGHADMECGGVDLEKCVNDALQCLSDKIEATRAVIVRDPLPMVKGDATLLAHLYQNLIGNALKFSREQPRIGLTCQAQGDQWLLGVRDNGIGIEPQFAHTIFAAFRRLHRRDEYEGAGIGLAICKKVVDRHGGRIWVESQPEAGAHFKFLLPQHPEQGRPSPVRPSEPSILEQPCLVG
ncbi:MAG TPA: ATP-binding protein [Pirellulales bacterium]|jgi:signal transduction histidine kinase|nr:ATP-binding protein [Pirellulales bacterium]